MSNPNTNQDSSSKPPQNKWGLANSSSWDSEGFAFAPNTNTMDAETMPSAEAERARQKSAQIMAALKAGDSERANALMGKDTTKGRLLPGMSWIKKKLDKEPSGKLQGVAVEDEPLKFSNEIKSDEIKYDKSWK